MVSTCLVCWDVLDLLTNTYSHHTHFIHYHHDHHNFVLHRALCSLFQPDTEGTRVSKCGQLSRGTRRLDPMLFQYWSRAVGGGANIETTLGQILVFAGLHTGVCLHPPVPSIIFSPADQGTFRKTAGQSQAYYNT